MNKFAAGFLTCYVAVAFAWGAILTRMDFPAPKAVWTAINWPPDFLSIYRAKIQRADGTYR